MLAENAAEEAAAAAAMGVRRVGAIEDLQCLDEDLDASGERQPRLLTLLSALPIPQHLRRSVSATVTC